VSAVALHYGVAGPDSGSPTVLFGGSLGTTLEMWEPQVRTLANRARVVPFDHRGHGGSPVPRGPYRIEDMGRDVLLLLDRLGLERASYCGLSIGGMVGMWLAANAPERIHRLVLIATAAYLPPASTWAERAAEVRAAETVEVLADTVLERWLTPDADAADAARLRSMLVATSPDGYAACCEAIGAMDLRESLGRITAPTLVIAAADDPATPPEHGRLIADAIPGARLEVVDKARHLLSVERDRDVTRLIADHLDLPEAA
jgi:3-oxoadipate enol-lactonase